MGSSALEWREQESPAVMLATGSDQRCFLIRDLGPDGAQLEVRVTGDPYPRVIVRETDVEHAQVIANDMEWDEHFSVNRLEATAPWWYVPLPRG